MLNRLFRSFSVTAIFLVAMASIAHAAPGQGAVHPEMIVSTQWLSEHLNDPKVIVLEVAAAMGPERASYDAGHIPGARLLLHQDFMEGRDAELPPPEKLKATFE